MDETKHESVIYDDIGPEMIVEVYDPKLKYHGRLVIDNTNLGMGKGGIRMTPTVTTVEVSRLARSMTYKNALAGLPFGGAKAGITADPRSFGAAHKKAIMESFARALRPLIPSRYIAGPDINTTEKDMQIFAQAHGEWESATGKPATFTSKKGGKTRRGLPHELGSTGYGVALSAIVAAESKGLNIKDATVSISGYGNVGTFVHKFLQEKGAKIIAVADSSGTVYKRDGLDYHQLMAVKAKTGSVGNYPGAKKLTRDVLYELTTDILIPAAGPDAIHEGNVGKVKATIIVEGANISIKDGLENTLHKKGILVIPGIIANAGGVISSYAEYKGYDAKKMFKLIEEKIVPNMKEVLAVVGRGNLSPNQAALKIARQRVLNASVKK